MLDVGRWTFGVFFRPQGRVAESGLRHSTRNRAWGNSPWVRIPPLPMLCLSVAVDVNDCIRLRASTPGFLRSPVRRESLCSPPDGCRFAERLRDLKRSFREKRRALRETAALCRRLAFRRFEQTLFGQPRVFSTKRKQLFVSSA